MRLPDVPKGTNVYIDALLNITILETPRDFQLVMNICRENKLMTRDALHVSVMMSHGISHIATGDEDFKRVPGITVWTPLRQTRSASMSP